MSFSEAGKLRGTGVLRVVEEAGAADEDDAELRWLEEVWPRRLAERAVPVADALTRCVAFPRDALGVRRLLTSRRSAAEWSALTVVLASRADAGALWWLAGSGEDALVRRAGFTGAHLVRAVGDADLDAVSARDRQAVASVLSAGVRSSRDWMALALVLAACPVPVPVAAAA